MSVTTQRQARDEMQVLRLQLEAAIPQFRAALPDTIKAERFHRVVATVVQQQPELLAADRKSLFAACMKCAADGLIPDGREAALVIFNTKINDRWEKRVQYMPMLTGILKRARNSGEIAGIVVNIVYKADDFVYVPDDFDRPVRHGTPPLGTDRGPPLGAYALAKLKDGTIMHDVMGWDQIMRVAAVSRSKDRQGNHIGPWRDWPEEMARKTVFRRLSKYLPMDASSDTLLRRDDEAGASTDAIASPSPSLAVIEGSAEGHSSRLDALEHVLGGDAGAVTDDGAGGSDEPPPNQDMDGGPVTVPPDAPSPDPDGEAAAADAYEALLTRIASLDLIALRKLPTDAQHRAELRALTPEQVAGVEAEIEARIARHRAKA